MSCAGACVLTTIRVKQASSFTHVFIGLGSSIRTSHLRSKLFPALRQGLENVSCPYDSRNVRGGGSFESTSSAREGQRPSRVSAQSRFSMDLPSPVAAVPLPDNTKRTEPFSNSGAYGEC